MAEKPDIEASQGVGPVIDPTKNVLDLVKAESKYQDGLREASDLLQNALREAETRRQDGLRNAETKRADDLDKQRTEFENRIELVRTESAKQIAAILSGQTDKSAILLSTTVDKLSTATNERLAAVEKNQYVSGGKSSVSDPATAEALSKMADAINRLSKAGDTSEGHSKGTSDSWGWIVGIGGLVASIVVVAITFASHTSTPEIIQVPVAAAPAIVAH
jgi:vacuolar-type H+-ATPase subunit H